ncbi:MAG: hypothetical protein KDB00_16730 [Planctomycetales bacterium]|nr:hypothetical protein [Planctomycetales bacterium]
MQNTTGPWAGFKFGALFCFSFCCIFGNVHSQDVAVKLPADDPFESGEFRWRVEPPFLAVDPQRLPDSPIHPWVAVKDPSIVRYDNRWHLFCTLRKDKEGDGRIRIGYLSFDDWAGAKESKWSVLDLTMGYHGAPQIFYFEPHRKWYLVYQAADDTRGLKYGPCFSTNDDISKPGDWTKPEPLYVVEEGTKAGLDFWVICDKNRAHLFFTTLNGQMWRSETSIRDFPNANWTKPAVALQADLFEASHTYALKGLNRFLTIVEAQADRRRYFKGFVADSLDGQWTPLAARREKPMVSPVNVVNQSDSWATSYSHGEFIRSGYDQRLEIDPRDLQLLFQGANDQEYQSGAYGDIPWRLGILQLDSPKN